MRGAMRQPATRDALPRLLASQQAAGITRKAGTISRPFYFCLQHDRLRIAPEKDEAPPYRITAMPRLKNPRHERFAREYVKDDNGIAYKAYIRAGYRARGTPTPKDKAPSASVCASKLLRKVLGRVEELRVGIQSRHDATEDAVIAELDETRTHALSVDQCGPAVQATVAKARIAGLLIEKKEVGNPGDFANARNREELQRLVIEKLGEADGLRLIETLKTIAQSKRNASDQG